MEISLESNRSTTPLPPQFKSYEGNAAAACLPLLAALARPGGAVVRLPLGDGALEVRKSA